MLSLNEQENRMKLYTKTSASAVEDFKGKDLDEKVEFIEVLEINCILFIPSNEKQYCCFTYGDSALK